MRWLVFGTYDKARHPRVGVMIEGLRAAGDTVVEVNVPMDLDTAARVRLLRQPWRIPVTIARLAKCWVQLARRSAGVDADAILVGYLGHLDVRLARTLFRRTPIVLDHLVSLAGTAADRGLADSRGLMQRILVVIDQGAMRAADLIVVDTEEHAAAIAEISRDKVAVVAVGAEDDWFAARRGASANLSGGELRVIFFGLFTALQGTVTLGRALGELAGDDIKFTIVGTGQDFVECRRLAAGNHHVTWLDWVSRAALPDLVAAHDVCLGIFGTTEKALNVVPTKVYQGAAAGRAIVTSDTGPQRRALHDAAAFVPAGNSSALADTIRQLASDRGRLAKLQSSAAGRADSGFGAVSVVAPLRARLGQLSATTALPIATHPTATHPTDREGMTPVISTKTPAPDAALSPRGALRWFEIRRILAELKPTSILEIGCGMGAVGTRLARVASYTAVEPDERSFTAAKDRVTPLGGVVLYGDHTVVPPGTQYDLVCAFEVLEHIADDADALAQWVPLVRPGGHLLLSVPADPARFGPSDVLVGHYRRYTAEDLTLRLQEAGAADLNVSHYAWPLGYVLDSIRDRIADRRTGDASEVPEERSSGSGRFLQPSGTIARWGIEAAVYPWAVLQRRRPDRGPGLIALAIRPAQSVRQNG